MALGLVGKLMNRDGQKHLKLLNVILKVIYLLKKSLLTVKFFFKILSLYTKVWTVLIEGTTNKKRGRLIKPSP